MTQMWKSKGDLREELRRERERVRQLTLALYDTMRIARQCTDQADDVHALAVNELIGRTYGRT
jgi:hypothetical protein